MQKTFLVIKNDLTDNTDTATDRQIYADATVIAFDATVAQSFIDRANITEHPIETGSTITDHINVLPETLSISGIASDELFFTLSEISSNTTQAALGGVLLTSFIASGQALAPTFQTLTLASAAAQVANSERAIGRTAKVYDLLRTAQRRGRIFDVVTPTRTYINMGMESLQVDKTPKTSLRFDMAFKKLVVVDTKKLATKPVNDTRTGQKKNGRKKTNAATGNTATKQLNSGDSFLANLVGFFQ